MTACLSDDTICIYLIKYSWCNRRSRKWDSKERKIHGSKLLNLKGTAWRRLAFIMQFACSLCTFTAIQTAPAVWPHRTERRARKQTRLQNGISVVKRTIDVRTRCAHNTYWQLFCDMFCSFEHKSGHKKHWFDSFSTYLWQTVQGVTSATELFTRSMTSLV